MASKKSNRADSTTTRTKPEKDPVQERAERQDWADEAAQARTADDPRAVAPRDRSGTPSQGEPL
ncbi:hypothetical protein GCM10027290_50580 [Micromonospora sonneratiae]|jgi:hypothetical protein|uniref:Uncharacterized protein n=1 Tax=Micromonospora sonneratiae TaxID=1184706 RepID=A0ABW3Y7K8_9ACTN